MEPPDDGFEPGRSPREQLDDLCRELGWDWNAAKQLRSDTRSRAQDALKQAEKCLAEGQPHHARFHVLAAVTMAGPKMRDAAKAQPSLDDAAATQRPTSIKPADPGPWGRIELDPKPATWDEPVEVKRVDPPAYAVEVFNRVGREITAFYWAKVKRGGAIRTVLRIESRTVEP